MINRLIALIILIYISILGLNHGLAQMIYIPAFDPVNGKIEELRSRGYLRELNISEKPWTRSDVITAIRNDENNFDKWSESIAHEILSSCRPTQKKASLRPHNRDKNMSGGLIGGFDLRGLSSERREGYFIRRDRYINRGFKNEIGCAFKAGWYVSQDSLWGIDSKMIYDTDGIGYPWYYSRAREARSNVQFDHAYGALRLGRIDVLLGRRRIEWGPSPRGSLILDRGFPPLDMAAFQVRIKPFVLSWFGGRLNDLNQNLGQSDIHRFLFGHRISLNTNKGWEIGLSEVVLYGGPGRLPEMYYAVPVVLYYWEAHNNYRDDNVLWEADLSWAKRGIGRFYLQFVADDIQYKSNGPQKFALQIGAHLTPRKYPRWTALIEANVVDTYVYGQRQPWNSYLNWGVPIARLGSDQYEIFAGVYRDLGQSIKAGLEFALRGKGGYDADIVQSFSLPDDIKFPSGIVELGDFVDFTVSSALLRKFELKLTGGYATIDNYNRAEGRSLNEFFSTIDISYNFELGLPFWTKYR